MTGRWAAVALLSCLTSGAAAQQACVPDQAVLALRELLETRLDAMDKATALLAENVRQVPTLLDRETARVLVLAARDQVGVQRQFEDRDKAINAALASQEKAVDKRELALSQQQAANALIFAQINSRLDRGDGSSSNQSASNATLLAVAALLVSTIVGGFTIFARQRST